MDFKCDELILGKKDADSRALTKYPSYRQTMREALFFLTGNNCLQLGYGGFIIVAKMKRPIRPLHFFIQLFGYRI